MDFQYFPKWTLLAWIFVALSGPSLQELFFLGILWGSFVIFLIFQNPGLQNQDQGRKKKQAKLKSACATSA